jgi:hypothetical protein
LVHRVTARGTHLGSSRRGSGPAASWTPCRPPAGPSKPTSCTFTGARGGKITGHAATRNDLLMLGLLPGIKPVSEAS